MDHYTSWQVSLTNSTQFIWFRSTTSILERLLQLSYENKSDLGDDDATQRNDDSGYDQYGFKEVANGFYNRRARKIWDYYHPHQ